MFNLMVILNKINDDILRRKITDAIQNKRLQNNNTTSHNIVVILDNNLTHMKLPKQNESFNRDTQIEERE